MSSPYFIGVYLAAQETEKNAVAFLPALGQGALMAARALGPRLLTAGRALFSPGGIKNLWGNEGFRQGVKGLGREMAIGGGFTGAVNAATAEPGDRMGAFMRGAGWGAAGGAAFRGIAGGVKSIRNTQPMQDYFAQKGMKVWGAKQLSRPGVVAMGATMGMPTGAKQPMMAGANDVATPGLPMSNLPPGMR